MQKTNLISLLLAVTMIGIGCKKDSVSIESNPALVQHQNRYSTNTLDQPRTIGNAVLAIEYELNMEVADTNMLNGSQGYDVVIVDSFYYSGYNFNNHEVSAIDQQSIYEDIREIVLDSLNNYYDDVTFGNAIVIDLTLDETTENSILVKYARSALTTNCSCTFTSNLPWSDLNIFSRDCDYFDDRSNNYYANCIGVRDYIGQYYDFKIETTPNNGLIYFTGGDISAATQTTVYLDGSMTPGEQIATRNYLYNHWEDYTVNHPDGRNELLKLYIGGTVGFANALYLHHLVRSKFSVGIPF